MYHFILRVKHSFMVVLLSKRCEVLHSCFLQTFGSSNLFPSKKFLNGLMVLDQDCVVDAAGLPTSTFATRVLSGLKSEVVLHHAQASLQLLIVLISFI
jgi:hypothetical protein